MEYTVNRLAKLSGVSTRTLRYYDQIGLLVPERVSSNGYRIYGQMQVDLLQQILFYRELGFELEAIRQLVLSPKFDRTAALESHLTALTQRREQVDKLIETVHQTLRAMKGEIEMKDIEKFEGFKQKLVDDNERQYGKEIREKYGNDVVDASNKKVQNMTQEQHAQIEALTAELNETLKAAFTTGDPKSETSAKAVALHKKWLTFYWPEGMYTAEAHIGMAQMYCDDDRFKAYYDKIAPGLAEFFRDAAVFHLSAT